MYLKLYTDSEPYVLISKFNGLYKSVEKIFFYFNFTDDIICKIIETQFNTCASGRIAFMNAFEMIKITMVNDKI